MFDTDPAGNYALNFCVRVKIGLHDRFACFADLVLELRRDLLQDNLRVCLRVYRQLQNITRSIRDLKYISGADGTHLLLPG